MKIVRINETCEETWEMEKKLSVKEFNIINVDKKINKKIWEFEKKW